jgi:hypothetical protein
MEVPWKLGTIWMWRNCACEEERMEAAQTRVRTLEAAKRQQEADALLGDTGMRLIEHLTLDRFDPRRLVAPDERAHPYHIASRWLAALGDRPTADYHSELPAALYFYSPGKGRGKTHLAAGLAWEARKAHKLTAYVGEGRYIDRAWACSFEEREILSALPGERAWLTVIDDLGQRVPGRGSQSIANAWYSVFDRRWLARGWTIITSNLTLEELVDQGTINDATYSRLRQMTKSMRIEFQGIDQRLA